MCHLEAYIRVFIIYGKHTRAPKGYRGKVQGLCRKLVVRQSSTPTENARPTMFVNILDTRTRVIIDANRSIQPLREFKNV